MKVGYVFKPRQAIGWLLFQLHISCVSSFNVKVSFCCIFTGFFFAMFAMFCYVFLLCLFIVLGAKQHEFFLVYWEFFSPLFRFTSVWWSQNIKHQLAFLPAAGAKNKIAQQEENDMHSGPRVVSGLPRGVSLTRKKQISWHRGQNPGIGVEPVAAVWAAQMHIWAYVPLSARQPMNSSLSLLITLMQTGKKNGWSKGKGKKEQREEKREDSCPQGQTSVKNTLNRTLSSFCFVCHSCRGLSK